MGHINTCWAEFILENMFRLQHSMFSVMDLTMQAHDAIKTSLLRWHNNDFIIALYARWVDVKMVDLTSDGYTYRRRTSPMPQLQSNVQAISDSF